MSTSAAKVIKLPETRANESLDEIILRAEARARERGVAYRGELAPEEAWRLAQEYPGAKLVDIRTPEELTLIGRVPGAVEIPWRLFSDWELNPRFLREIKKTFLPADAILLLCRSSVRSREAAELLAGEGFGNCFNVLEGFEGDKNEAGQRVIAGWKVRGLPWSQ
ncbi:MAG: rhodanese-like domain-containing protein [Candidatus Accumulibacter sp.]|jgi:rhodanese-related sulfurtransferase|nr:rhodanese-like domain-containing protein [Accumulibacter sp.]